MIEKLEMTKTTISQTSTKRKQLDMTQTTISNTNPHKQ